MNRRRGTPSLSLFPFLAVLICTMGVLVALLLLVVKQADLSSQQTDSAQTQDLQQRIDDYEGVLAELEFRSQMLTEHRPANLRRLEEQREELAHLENEMHRLHGEAQRLDQRLQDFMTVQQPGENAVAIEQQLQLQREKLDHLRTEMAAALADGDARQGSPAAAAAPVYSIVPIAAHSGTNRRPIYIECREDGMYLHPGAIRLNLEDFILPLAPGNPLDTALMAYREYWRNSAGQDRQAANAYPLLVVRPSGAKWYSVARRAMDGWDEQYGYELVPEEWQVDFGKVDPKLVEQVQLAIQRAQSRQATLVALGQAVPADKAVVAAAGAADFQGGQANRGGALIPAADGGFSSAPAALAARAEAQGRRPGGNSVDPVAAWSTQYFSQRPPGGATDQLGGPDNADAGWEPAGQGSARRSSSRMASSRLTPTGSDLMARANATQSGHSPGAGTLADAQRNATAEPNFNGNIDANSNRRSSANSHLNAHANANLNPSLSSNLYPNSNSNSNSNSNLNAGLDPQRQSHLSSNHDGRRSTTTQRTADFRSDAAAPSASGSGNSSAATGASGPSATRGAPGAGSSSAAGGADQAAGVGIELNPDSLAHQRGADWALPSRRSSVSAYHRPVAVVVQPQALILKAGPGSREDQVITFTDNVDQAIDPLIDAIWQRVDRWGYLGFGGYWKPVLQLQYAPDQEATGQQLERLLQGSGLELESTGDGS